MKSKHLSQRHPSVTPLSYLHFRGFHPSNKTQDARNQEHVWISSYLFCPIQNRGRTYNWRPIFCSENIFENLRDCWLTVTIYNLLCTLLPMNGKEVGKQKLEIAVTHYPLYAAHLSLEKGLRGKIWCNNFDTISWRYLPGGTRCRGSRKCRMGEFCSRAKILGEKG